MKVPRPSLNIESDPLFPLKHIIEGIFSPKVDQASDETQNEKTDHEGKEFLKVFGGRHV